MKKKLLTLTFTLILLIGLVAAMGMNASAATCPIDGATGAGTEADPIIVDNLLELEKALEYNGTLYVVAKNFATSNITSSGSLPYIEISSKKVLYLKQDLEIKQIDGAKGSLFSVKDGADFTMIADGRRKIKYTYTVLELAGPTAKATLKGELIIETTTDDGSQSSYALVAHQGNILIDGGSTSDSTLKISSASLKNNAAVFKNGTVKGKIALSGTAFKLYQGSVGFFNDKDQDFLACPNFGTTGVIREDLRVACIGGFNEQSPALEGSNATLTAAEEKAFLGMSRKYTFKTADNTAWAEDFVYTPKGTIEVIDSTNNIIYSKSDSDSGTFDKNVSLSIDLKDVIKAPGKYKIRETISLTRDGISISTYTHIYPIDVVEFNTFLGQSPAMSAGSTEFYLGEFKQASYPVKFYAHSLSQGMIDEGYKSIAILKVYKNNADNTYVYGEKAYCDKGQKISYDLNSLPADIYRLVETIELRDKNNKVVKSAENTFYIDWTPQQDIKEVNITANWQGTISAPVCKTKGVKIVSYRWEKYDGSNWNTLDTSTPITGGGRYRCTVELAAETGYKLASSYTVKIGGVAAKKYSGSVDLWFVSRDITGYVNFVDIEHSYAPEAGTYPEFEGYEIVQAGNTAVKLVEWYKCDKDGKKLSDPLTAEDMFEKDSYYRLEVTVAPETNYEFKNAAEFRINDKIVNYNTSHGIDIPGSITGYTVYNVNDAEGKYELYLYDGNQTKDIIIKDGQYIASNSATPVTTKPSVGYAYYKNGVLTFDGYNNAKAHFVFEEGNLDVYLKGRNRIGAIYNSEHLGANINDLDARKGNMTISADARASLTVASNPLDAYCNIYVNALTFNSGKVISCLANGTYGSAIYADKLIIADGYKAYVGETNNFDASEEWNGIADIKDYENVWLDENVCRHSLHKYEKTAASCIYEGYKETFEVCEKCYLYVVKEDGTVLTETEVSGFLEGVVIPKTGVHTGGTATCKAKAKCTVCGKEYGSLAGHSYNAATCTTPKTCKVCGATSGSKLGHTYDNACDTTCNRCSATRTITHSYKNVTTKATLTKNGKVENKCSVCGNVKSTTTVYYPKTIKLSATKYTYNGKAKKPSVTVKDSKGKALKKDTDYTVKYASGRKSTGKYTVTVTFKGKYSGTKKLTFNILPSKTSKITPTCSTTEIKASWKKVTGASGYKVELLNSKGKVVKKVTTTKTSYTFKKLSKVTTYKIRVTAYKTIDKKAAYSTVSTTITTSTAPAKVTLSKVTAGSKSATPAWKTVSGASGYEVQYSTSSKFKSAKTATVKKGSSKKTTIKKLTKGKKYYVKVRAYKTVGKTKIYSAWSSVKTVKVK